MDLVQFLTMRMDFVRHFYGEATKPFAETIAAIEGQTEPFVPVYDESGEPQFLSEWQDAGAGVQAIGLSALSMLSSAFELFLKAWVLLHLPKGAMSHYKRRDGEGWWPAYRRLLSLFGLDATHAGVHDALIEQAVLARNRGQHPTDLLSNDIRHNRSDLSKCSPAYFVSESDLTSAQMNETGDWWLPPRIHVDAINLDAVIAEMTQFAHWLDQQPIVRKLRPT